MFSHFFGAHWHQIIGGVTLLLQLIASSHAILYRRDSRAAISWVGFIWLVPLFGVFLYLLFGINRVQRKATAIRGARIRVYAPMSADACLEQDLIAALSERNAHLQSLKKVMDQITQRKLVPGNLIKPLENGEEAYPAMLRAIDEAQRSIALSTYIFNNDEIGNVFLDALARACARGVAVRILIDAVGARYSLPSIIPALKRNHIPYARFMQTYVPARMAYLNLRNHRKLLIVDGRIGFSGGMNIKDDQLLKGNPSFPTRDIHFRIEGPAVAHLQETFAEDWLYSSKEKLEGDLWFPILAESGKTPARGVRSGPDEDFELMHWAVLGALDSARSKVHIVTPYFVPDQILISAINLCILKGVEVNIVLPSKNNLILVQWASMGQLWQMLQYGARIWMTPPPFDHSKIMIVDSGWSLFGSANWDMRSFRLNFEFNMECYDAHLAKTLTALVEQKMKNARLLTLDEINNRGLPLKFRDGVARLFSPYL